MEIIKILKDRSSSWPSNSQLRAVVDFHSNGEYGEVMDAPVETKIIKAGNINHRHTLTTLPWKESDGKEVDNFEEFVATFRDRIGCTGCDYVAIVSRRALY